MENGSKPVPGATLSPPTVSEMQEIVDILKDPTPDKWGEGWIASTDIIRLLLEQEPEMTEEQARSKMKTMVRLGELEKISHLRRAYYRVKK